MVAPLGRQDGQFDRRPRAGGAVVVPTSLDVAPVKCWQRSVMAGLHIFPWQGPIVAVEYRFSVSMWSNPSATARAMSFSVTSSQRQTKLFRGRLSARPLRSRPEAVSSRRLRVRQVSRHGESSRSSKAARFIASNAPAGGLGAAQMAFDELLARSDGSRGGPGGRQPGSWPTPAASSPDRSGSASALAQQFVRRLAVTRPRRAGRSRCLLHRFVGLSA